MDGYDNLVQTLSRFEQSLGGQHPLTSVQTLAKVSGYSPHHFSRLFSSHTNLRLKEYLQARQLTALILQKPSLMNALMQTCSLSMALKTMKPSIVAANADSVPVLVQSANKGCKEANCKSASILPERRKQSRVWVKKCSLMGLCSVGSLSI